MKTSYFLETSLTVSGPRIMVKNSPNVYVVGDFNFKNIAWPDRLNKSGSMLTQSEGHIDRHHE